MGNNLFHLYQETGTAVGVHNGLLLLCCTYSGSKWGLSHNCSVKDLPGGGGMPIGGGIIPGGIMGIINPGGRGGKPATGRYDY